MDQIRDRNLNEMQRAGVSKSAFAAGLIVLSVFSITSSFTPADAQSKGQDMEKVEGIGGFFFRSENPEALRNWYSEHLGVDMAPQFTGGAPWQQEEGFTVFDPFAQSDTMIPDGKQWMINFRVGNLEKMIEQLRATGIEVSDLETYPHGKFASLTDPEGNGIQLWEVAAP